jgi:hypothetical protein
MMTEKEYRAAFEAYNAARDAFRNMEIDDDAFLEARAVWDAINAQDVIFEETEFPEVSYDDDIY